MQTIFSARPARRFRRRSHRASLAKAKTIIEECGYGRRYDELADLQSELDSS